ncbi:hypothetical protein D9M69_675890 [compost metagenome]
MRTPKDSAIPSWLRSALKARPTRESLTLSIASSTAPTQPQISRPMRFASTKLKAPMCSGGTPRRPEAPPVKSPAARKHTAMAMPQASVVSARKWPRRCNVAKPSSPATTIVSATPRAIASQGSIPSRTAEIAEP